MTRLKLTPTRRTFLAASTASLLARPSRTHAAPGPTVVDIHCHVFNGSDLPITGFLAHFIPGLSDVSRELTDVPEMIVRKIVGVVHERLINRVAPALAEEKTFLDQKTSAGEVVKPVTWFEDSQIVARYDSVMKALADEVAALPLLGLDGKKVNVVLDRVVRLLYLVSHERARIAATMATVYSQVDLFTPLLVDYDAWSNDKPFTKLVDQIDAHAAVSRASTRGLIGRPGARFHPFIAFDPKREANRKIGHGPYKPYDDARVFDKGTPYRFSPVGTPAPARPAETAGGIELVRYAIESAGFIGCKVYPPVGFAPLDNAHLNPSCKDGQNLDLALRAFYAYCEAEEVPITTHASVGNEYGLGFRDFVSPARWEPVLREFPKLRLNLGHFGHAHGVDPDAGVMACTAWIRQAAKLMSVYANVYADLSNSALVYDEAYATKYLGFLNDIFESPRYRVTRTRVMYGSDFWLNRLGNGADDFVKEFRVKLERKFGAATRDDIMGTNALRFLGFLDKEGKKPADSRNRARLLRFYGDQSPPSWLAGG